MKRRLVDWNWENSEAQAAFTEWVGFPDAAATAREVDDIERLVSLRQAESILDVGCGNGRHAVELAERGHGVVGIDIAKTYVEEARRTVEQAGVAVEIRLRRASKVGEKACYDLALAINHTLDFMDDQELAAQFGRIAQALRPGGRLLLKTAGPQCLPGAASHSVKNWGEKAGRFILSEKRMAGRVRIEHNIVIDTVKGEIVECHEEQRAFSRDEVVRLLQGSGFAAVKCLRDLSGAAATDERFGTYLCTT